MDSQIPKYALPVSCQAITPQIATTRQLQSNNVVPPMPLWIESIKTINANAKSIPAKIRAPKFPCAAIMLKKLSE